MKEEDLLIIRNKIDKIDREIMQLLNQRMEISVRARNLKEQVFDEQREQEVIRKAQQSSRGLIQPAFSEKLYKYIMDESRDLQKRDLKLTGFQGEHGAHGEAALLAYDNSLVPLPCREIYDVFHEIASGQLDLGIVPIENYLEGPVTEVNDLLIETELKIVGEVKMPIHHCLLVPHGTEYRDLKIVYAHPQTLGQCRGFIERHKLEPKPYHDNAAAARILSETRSDATCVIANKMCAELYNLEIVQEDVEDQGSNSTRFIILSREMSQEHGDKCSIIFTLDDKAGALFSILKIFSDQRINLTRIESKPSRIGRHDYVFFTDIEGSIQDDAIARVLDEVRKHVRNYKFCGCYKAHK